MIVCPTGSTNVSNSKKQKDQSELVSEKVEVSTVSEADAAASKEEDPFHTAVELCLIHI